MTKPDDTSKYERQIQQLRDMLFRPVGEKFGFPILNQGSATGQPTVLCLGNHSSGKSTFINSLAGGDVQDTGVAPTDDGFTLITFGPEQTLDGRAVVADPNLPYQDLQQFGKDFVDHLRMKRRPLDSLKNMYLIDSPGMIDSAGDQGEASRGYNFSSVVRWFAESADLIVFFFDPDKPGTTGESLRVFTESLDNVMYKLLIVFNKVDSFEDVRDFARTYGSLCWNLSRVVRTKDIPHIYCTFVDGIATQQSHIDLADFQKSTVELKQEISRVGLRRRTNLVSSLLDSGRALRMHASVARRVGWRMMVERSMLWSCVLLLVTLGGWFAWQFSGNGYAIAAGVVSALVGIGLAVASKSVMGMRLEHHVALLDKYFREEYREQMLKQQNTQFIEGQWQAVKPRVEHFLRSQQTSRIPFSPLWPMRFRKLDSALSQEIPNLLGKLSEE